MVKLCRAALILVMVCAACDATRGGGGGAGPSGTPQTKVPDGYHGMAWGTPKDRIEKADPELAPSKINPRVLVRKTTANGMPASEAFFFDAHDLLTQVEFRFTPKRNATEAAALAVSMDKSMGPHEVALADDNAYQLVWAGEGTEVRLSWDLRESVAFGPVLTWAPAVSTPPGTAASHAPTATATATALVTAKPGACFVSSVHELRSAGMHLTAVESGKGRLSLVFETAGSAKEIALTADPKTGSLIGCASVARAAPSAALQFSAEAALDTEVAKSEPVSLKFGGAAAISDVVTIQFANGGWIALRPGVADSLAGHGNRNDVPHK